ncbi:AMP-binding protein [Lutibacter sp. TH_r2]|uniref:AMP-binding protein n=1 Tax=Lutibacter sp. TH_r2 TaxID=3082083 RepID=UPI0029549C82|nr:AMP-binding protein [Lutibacter sp. TH_r2]MDV7186623.1 AMP-binding protein [Lutibacter sp. TH_r2]
MAKNTWKPTNKIINNSNIYKMMQKNGFQSYTNFWRWSVENKEAFWQQTVENLGIPFHKNFDKILDTSKGIENAEWLKGAEFNIVDACFQNGDDDIAVVFQEEEKSIKKVTQKELENLVNKIANSLIEHGLKVGDAIAIDMPMTLEAVAIYLAGIKAGMPIVTIADSFTPSEIKVRLNIAKPKVIFTQDYLQRAGKTLHLFNKVVEANAPKAIVIQTIEETIDLRENDIFWNDFLSKKTSFKSVIQKPEEVITILFSSGTTGKPKAIPWTHLTPIKSASDGYYHQNIQKSDVVCWPTNLGWMMGPWLVFASLINKAAIGLYYGIPTGYGFGKFVQDANVTMLGVIPSIVKYWKSSKCMEQFNWDNIKCFSSTGEVSNPTEMEYLMQLVNNKPVIEYCGGTEIGGGYITSTVVQENIASTFSSQALGGEFVLLNEENNKADKGEVFLIPPILGLSNRLINRDHFKAYYEGTPTYKGKLLRRHGDQMQQLENGYYKAQGRVDDAMNLGGIKVSSIQIEAVINKLDFVNESAAIAVSPKNGGPSELVVYSVEFTSEKTSEEKYIEAKNCIKKQLNPLFKLVDLVEIEKLPRTASNKVMRRKLRDLYLNK